MIIWCCVHQRAVSKWWRKNWLSAWLGGSLVRALGGRVSVPVSATRPVSVSAVGRSGRNIFNETKFNEK